MPVNGKRIQITKCGFATNEKVLEAGNKKLIDYYRNGEKKQILDKVDEIYPYVFELNDENENCPPKKS